MSSRIAIDKDLKVALKEAVAEALRENRDLLQEILVEVLEDMALGEAIIAGKKAGHTTRAEVQRALQGKA